MEDLSKKHEPQSFFPGAIWNRARTYLLVQAVVVLLVVLIFRNIQDRRLAGLIAGGLFILSASSVALYEFRFGSALKSFSFWGSLCFLLFSAFPIFFLRISKWNEDFSQVSLFGLQGPQLHQMGNLLFLLALITYFIDSYRYNRAKL